MTAPDRPCTASKPGSPPTFEKLAFLRLYAIRHAEAGGDLTIAQFKAQLRAEWDHVKAEHEKVKAKK